MKKNLTFLVIAAFMISAFAVGSTAFACGGGDHGDKMSKTVEGEAVE